MSKKKIISLIFGVIIVIASIIYLIIINKPEEQIVETDASKFKSEYEVLNGVLNEETGKITREISISDNNPIVYATMEEIVNKIDNKETFVVYFGFAKCPWCRSVLETLLSQAKKDEISKIYYVDVLETRDTFILEDNQPKLNKKASQAYYDLLDRFKDVLTDYNLTNEDGEKISTGEKRIYAPNVMAVVDGETKIMKSGISSLQKDPYEVLTDEMLEETTKQFEELFSFVKPKICEKEGC